MVHGTDENGKTITEYSSPLELTIAYNDTLLEIAGFTPTDETKLSIYLWDNETGYYAFVGGQVNTEENTVTASITLPGQYLLAIDELAPLVLDFRTTDSTAKPTITFKINDNLSGVDAETLSIFLDDTEIVNNANYSDYFDIRAGFFSYSVETPLTSGEHVIKITIGDTAGNIETHDYTFTVNTVPPVIEHTPITSAVAGNTLEITANVTDDEALSGVFLHYRAKTGEMSYQISEMTKTGGAYTGTIPKAYLTSFGARYYIRAVDISGNAAETAPADITVQDTVGPEITGELSATLTSEGFTLNWNDAKDADIVGYRIYTYHRHKLRF